MLNTRTNHRNNAMGDSRNIKFKKQTFGHMLQSDQNEYSFRISNTSDVASPSSHDRPPPPSSTTSSPYGSSSLSPWDQSPTSISTPSWDPPAASPLSKSPWTSHVAENDSYPYTGLMGSLVREEGHIYSLATSGDLLYTGSDSKNIRVWKNQKEFSGFKSNSGLVKAIIIAGDRIFSGHQDGKIRVWKISRKNPSIHKRIGTLPTFKAKIKSSFNPSNYIEVRRNRSAIWIQHNDAVSSLSLSGDRSLLYSASWDKTIKVWRVSDSKCLESIKAHDDAVNAVAAGFAGLVFSGAADGSVKVWRRETQGKGTKHFFSQTLLKQECAVTSLAVDAAAVILYSGSSDGIVNFWEGNKFLRHGGILRGHKLAVLCLATAGSLVFTGSADTNICVWRREEAAEHVCLSVLSGHSGPVKCLAVEEDDKGGYPSGGGDRQFTVYSGSLDKSVKIWKVSAEAAPMRFPMGNQHGENFSSGKMTALPSVQNVSSQNSRTRTSPIMIRK